jgi:hypothetical protein
MTQEVFLAERFVICGIKMFAHGVSVEVFIMNHVFQMQYLWCTRHKM